MKLIELRPSKKESRAYSSTTLRNIFRKKQSKVTLPPNKKGIIVAIDVDQKLKSRLIAIGLYIGAEIEFIRSAPLGDPYEFLVSGNMITIRKEIARKIEIEVIL